MASEDGLGLAVLETEGVGGKQTDDMKAGGILGLGDTMWAAAC